LEKKKRVFKEEKMSKAQRLRELQEEVNNLKQENEALRAQIKAVGEKPWTIQDYIRKK